MADLNVEKARFNMVEQQVRPWDVLDPRVLDLILKVPREEYVLPEYRALAFTDMELPLGHDQVMLAPRVAGRLAQALRIQPEDTVLEVGTGSGYVTALLAGLGRHVYSVEIVPELKAMAEKLLAQHGVTNVTLDEGDGVEGWPSRGTYDAIAVTGSVPVLPEGLKQALNVGGRLFVVVGDAPIMEARLITRVAENEWVSESLFETVIPPLMNAPRANGFTF